MLRAREQGPTTPERHKRNNELQYLQYKRDRPQLYARMLESLPPEERQRVETIVSRLEAEEGLSR